MELSLTNSLSSAIELSQQLFKQDPELLQQLAVKLNTSQQPQVLSKYAQEIEKISRQTGLDITKLAYPLTTEPLTVRQDQTTSVSPTATSFEQDVSGLHKLLQEDKLRAQEMIQNLVAMARATKQEFMKDMMDKPIHPYEQMIQEYLGKNFKPKPVEEMVPDPELNLIEFLAKLTELSKKLQEKAMIQVRKITEQALDTSFPGITSEALGTAFATLCGNDFVVDREMTKRHLEFVENVRAIPVDFVVANPYEAAKKVIAEFNRCDYAF